MTIIHPLDVAANRVGGRPALARLLGVTGAAIGNWKKRGVPYEHCVQIERLCDGAVTRRDLRPADWQSIWPELADVATAETNQPASTTHQAPAAI